MEEKELERLRELETKLAVTQTKLATLEGQISNLKGGINRGLWILGGGFIAAFVNWILNGGLNASGGG